MLLKATIFRNCLLIKLYRFQPKYSIRFTCSFRLTIIPPFPIALQSQLEVANLSHNSITTIESDTFENYHVLEILDLSHNLITGGFQASNFNITRLRYLSLSNNQIRRIQTYDNSATSIYELTILDLSFNNLSRLSAENFKGFPNLQTLRIDHNQLETLDISWFAPAQFLRSLHASGNLITHVTMSGPTAFRNLTLINVAMNKIAQLHTEIFFQLATLATLDISFNDLTSINPIENFANISRTIFAEGNPWHCSCNLTQIYNDLKDNNIILACKTESECLYCETPASFNGILVKNACSAISDQTSLFVIIGGASAGLVFILLTIIGVLCVLRNRKKASQTEDNRRLESDLPSSHASPRRNQTNNYQANTLMTSPQQKADKPQLMTTNLKSPSRVATPLPTTPETSESVWDPSPIINSDDLSVLDPSTKRESFLFDEKPSVSQAQEDQYRVPSTFPTTQLPFPHHNPKSFENKASASLNPQSHEHVYANDGFQNEGEYMVMNTEKENPTTDNQASSTTQPPGIPRRTTYQNINHQRSKSSINPSDVYQELDNVTPNNEPTTPQRAGTVYLKPMN